jgi:hypothetical protein
VDAGALYDGEAQLAPLADGGAAVVFVVDQRACGLALFGPRSAAILAAIGRAGRDLGRRPVRLAPAAPRLARR